jgi:hypothetical protein
MKNLLVVALFLSSVSVSFAGSVTHGPLSISQSGSDLVVSVTLKNETGVVLPVTEGLLITLDGPDYYEVSADGGGPFGVNQSRTFILTVPSPVPGSYTLGGRSIYYAGPGYSNAYEDAFADGLSLALPLPVVLPTPPVATFVSVIPSTGTYLSSLIRRYGVVAILVALTISGLLFVWMRTKKAFH